jgi:hypothetical protein
MLEGSAPPAWLAEAAEGIGEPGFVLRVEVRGLLQGISKLMRKAGPRAAFALAVADGGEVPVFLSGGVDGRVHRARLRADVGKLGTLFPKRKGR